MKYRKHNAGQTSSIVGQKAQKKELRSQVLRSVMAFGVAMSSFMGMVETVTANGITDTNGKELMNNNKADIWAQDSSGKVGLNQFKDFNVAKNQMANLYFQKQGSSEILDTLVNTVENRIDIQGTVNAIRDNKIGGNLYFLSPKGMVIGAGGVINAGSLTAITMNQSDLPSDASAAEKAIREGTLKASSSLDGSIVVNGQINTMTGIDLQAAAIYVQKANEGANAPSLRTGVVFNNTVNTDGIYEVDDSQKLTASISDGKIIIGDPNAKNNTNLQGDGSIKLTAAVNEKNAIDKDSFWGKLLDKNTLAKSEVKVGEGATIAAAGDVSITSDSQLSMTSFPENIKTTEKDGEDGKKVTEEGDHWYNYIGTAKANTEVNGNVSGANVTISSKASSELEADHYHNFLEVVVNDAKDEVPDFVKKIADAAIKKMSKSDDTSDKKDDATTDKDKEQQESQASAALTGILNQAFVTYGSTEATANTTIGSKAKITADGDLAVTATSNVANTAKLTVRPEVEKDKTSYAEAFTGGLIYEDNVSHATVNVDGTLTSAGKTDIKANATSKVAASMGLRNSVYASDKDSTNDKKDPTTVPSLATIAVGVNSQDSKAEVNIGKKNTKATVTAGKDLHVNATTNNEMTSAVMALNNDNTTLSTTVNVATSNGNATVNNAGKLTSNDGNVTIQAAENLNKLDVITGNAFSDNLYEGAEAVFNSKVYEEPISKKFSPLAQLLYAQNQYAPGKNVSISGDTWKNYFDVGAAISVSNVTNTAQVNLDESSRIQSKGDTTIDAGVTIGDVRNITSHVLQISNKDTDYGVSAAVGVSNMTNTAEVNVKSSNASEDAINAEGNVTIHANTTQEYKRFESMVNALDKAWKNFQDNWTTIPSNKADLETKYNTLKRALGNVKSLIPKNFDLSKLNKQDVREAAKNLYNLAYTLDEKHTLLPTLEAFMDASNYANMYVASSAGKVAGKGDATAMASGSVGVQNLTNNAHVNIGPNTSIKAGGDAKITADVNETNVMVAGRLIVKSLLDNTGSPKNTSMGLGGTVGVQNAYTDSLVKVANDVTIDANAIQLETNNDVLNIGAAVGGAKTSKLGITGMVNYLGGTSHANTLVDDDVNLTAKKELNMAALNDTNVISVVGDFMSGENSSIGVSTGVISYDVETKAKVANLEANEDGTSSESAQAKKGTISASAVKVSADTEGTINNLTVAGVTSGSKKESGSGSGSGSSGEAGDKDDKKTDNKNGDAGGVDVKDDGGNSIISDTESGESGSSDITIGGDTDAPAPSVSDDEPPAPPASGDVDIDIDKPTTDKTTTQAARNGVAEGEGEAPAPGQGEAGGSGDSGDNKGEGSGEAGKDDGGDPAPGAGESGGSEGNKDKTTTIRINAAGSVSWNYVKDDTEAGLDNVTINLKGQDSSLTIEAQDNSYIGAYSGAMALTKMGVSNDKDSDGNRKFDASLSGAIAKNDLHKVTWASLGNTTVTTEEGATADILNYAHNSGAQVAAGVSLGLETGKRSGGVSVNLGASGSANYVDSQVHADMTGNTLSGKNTTISNIAYDQDIQVAGGVTAQYANSNASVGAAASINKVKNDIQAAMKNNNIGTSTSSVQNVENIAGSHLTQVGSAISVGVSRGGKSYAVGNVAISNNSITNTVNASVDGDTILAGKVSVEATDGKISINGTEAADNSHVDKLNTKNADSTTNTLFDLTGEDAMVNANGKDGFDMNAKVEKDKESATYEHKKVEVTNKGNTIVGTALGLGVKTGSSDKASAAGAAAAVVNSVKNNFTATVKGATISTGASSANDAAMKVGASSDTKMIGVAAGVAATVKSGEKASFAASGSGVRQSIQNETTATVEDTTVNTDHLKISGETSSTLVSVAGQVSAETGKSGVAAGLTWANNKLKNTTGAYAKGLTLSGISNGETNLDVAGTNNSSAWAVAAGASVSLGNGAVEGAGAINEGTNNTEAIVDMSDSKKKTTITDAKSIQVKATDKASAKAIAGTVAVAVSEGDKPSATIGGALSYNNIGNSATDKQHVTAKLNNATITTAEEADIQVVADNQANFLNLALGGAVRTGSSSGGAAQGSVAITTLYTDTLASMEGTYIDRNTTKKNGKVSVNANSESHITNSADGIAASVSTGEGISLAGSGAVSTIKSDADTKANITGGELHLKNLIAQAKSDNQITNISMGLSAAIGTAGGSGALAGNVATNTIANDTAVSISGATVVADGTVAALAKSNEQIANYGGAVSVGATAGNAGVALGATIVTNTITGNTTSNVSKSSITAMGHDEGVSVNDQTVKETTDKNGNTNHSVENNGTTKKGFVVNAEANHAIRDISITGAVGVSATTGVAADATVVINTIGGKTSAEVYNTDINTKATDLKNADVSVTAYDKADINSHLGTLAVGASGTAGVGAAGAGDRNTVSRETLAEITSDNKGASWGRYTLNAHDASVKALGETKIHVSESGVAAGASGAGAAAAIGSVSDDHFTSQTRALISGMKGTVHDLDVTAHRLADVKTYNNSFALSGGIGSGSVGVGVTNIYDESATNAEVAYSNFDTDSDTEKGHIQVDAHNYTELKTELSDNSLAVSIGGAASVSVANVNIESQVRAKVSNSELGTENSFDTVSVTANNDISNTYTNVSTAESSLLGVAVGKGAVNINTGTSATVSNSTIQAGTITIGADEKRNIQATMVGASVGVLGVGANVMYTNVGSSLQDSYGYDRSGEGEDVSYGTSDFQNYVNEALPRMNREAEGAKSYDSTIQEGATSINKGNAGKAGVQTTVTNSTLHGTGDVDIHAKATTDTDISIKQAGVGALNVAVAANRTDVEDTVGVTLSNATVEGKNVGIHSTTDGTIQSYTGQGGFSGGSYRDTTAYVKHGGTNQISIDGSTLTVTDAEKELAIRAANAVKMENKALNINIDGVDAGRLVLDSEDASRVAVNLGTDTKNTKENKLTASSVQVKAENAPSITSKTEADVSVSGLKATGEIVNARASGSASVHVTEKNHFASPKTEIAAVTKADIQALAQAVNVTGTAVTVNKARTYNTMEANATLGAAKFNYEYIDTDQQKKTAYGDLQVGASNASTAKADIFSVGVSGVAVGNNLAQNYTDTKVSTTIDAGNKGDTGLVVNQLDAYATNTDTVTATASGTSAAVSSISPLLAKVENTAKGTAKVDVKGNIVAKDSAQIRAIRKDTYNLKADGLTATIAGGGAAGAENQIDNQTDINVDNAFIDTAGDLLLDAENQTTMNRGNGFEKMILASDYAAFSVDTGHIDNTISSKAHVNLKNSYLSSLGDMKLIANNVEDLMVSGYVYNVTASGGAETRVNNTITNEGGITLDNSNAKVVKAGKDLTLSSADDVKLYTYADAEAATGTISGANSLMKNKITRNNNISLTNGSTLFSGQDINLYAGKHADGSLGLLDLNSVAAIFVGGVIPVPPRPSVDNEIDQSNQITIDSKSDSRSIRHSNFYAASGREMATVYANRYVGVYGSSEKGGFVTSDKGESIQGKTTNNFVKVDGKAVAGIGNKIDITIGKEGDVIVLDDALRGTITSNSNVKGRDYIQKNSTISADDSTNLSLTFGTEDYANTLLQRYQEVCNLMLEYAKDNEKGKESAAYKGYAAEATRLEQEMVRLGLAKEEDGKITSNATLLVDYVEIPELNSSGGNITVDTDDLVGSGTMKAQGTPTINITNNTNLMTKVNDITVGEAGGSFIYNGKKLTSDATDVTQKTADLTKQINDINKNKEQKATFEEITSEEGSTGTINIHGKYNGNSLSFKVSPKDENGNTLLDSNGKPFSDVTISMNPLANILIQGNVYAKDGKINITSDNNSILIQGKGVKDAVAVNGKDVVLKAVNGSITQGYTDGIVNIGGSVKDKYKDRFKKEIEGDVSGDHSLGETIKETIEDGSEGKGSYIAGDSVYINASDINVNGVIQSGFGDYYADISDAATKDAIERINKSYDGQQELSDAAVTTGEQYKIIKGGAFWDAKAGCYKYKLNVYYNPSTKKILVENVNAGGGQVYLTGRISSTGNGQIICLDGVSDISVKNSTNYDLKLGQMTTRDEEGLVSISDTTRNTLTEIRKGTATVKKLDTKNVDSNAGGFIDSAGIVGKTDNGYAYVPETGLKYTWTEGKDSTTYTKYNKEVTTGGWSFEWSSSESIDKLNQWVKDQTAGTSGTTGGGNTTDRPNGETIRESTGSQTYDNQVTVSKKHVTDDIHIDGVSSSSSGWWGYYRKNSVTWTKSSGDRYTYDASIKADNPIGIKFIGQDAKDGKVSVSSTGTGDIYMTGDIGNTKLYETTVGDNTSRNEKGTVSISAKGGSLIQSGGSLYGENINLAARKDMQDIQIIAGDTVNVSAIHDATGLDTLEQNTIDLTINGQGAAKGNVVLGNIGSVSNNAYLKDNMGITGHVTIKTTGTEGTISQKEDSAIVADRIDLTSENGSIYGKTKADTLKVNAGQQPMGLDTLSASVNATAKGDISLEQITGDMRIGHILSKEGDVNLNIAHGSVVDAFPYDTDDRGDADDLVARWKALGLINGGNGDMVASKTKLNHKKDLGDYKVWDQNELLYTIQDSVVNPTSDNLKKTSSKDPNVVGKNITITVADSVGLNSDTAKEILVNDGTTDANGNYTYKMKVEDLKALAKADASNVTWKKADGKLYAVISEKLPIGVRQTSADGKLTIRSNATDKAGNIYLEGRQEKDLLDTVNKNLNVGKISTVKGDVTISSLGGITQTDTSVIGIAGKNLSISAAAGSIGTKENHITTDLFGKGDNAGLIAIASGGIYMDQKSAANDLIVRSVSSGGDIYLGSDKSILMGTVTGTDAVNYIRAENNGSITLEARGGSIGEAETDEKLSEEDKRKSNKGVRILNSGTENKSDVTLRAKDNVYVTGIASADGKTPTTAGKAGSLDLTVGSVDKDETLKNVGISVDGTLNLTGDLKSSETASIFTTTDLTVGQSISSKDTYVGSAGNMTLSGNILGGTENLTLEANQSIDQTQGSAIAKNTKAKAGKDINLASRTNKLQNVSVDAQNGSATIVSANDVDGDLNVTTVGNVANDLTITNLKNGKANKIHFDKNIKAGGNITITNEEADIEVATGTTMDAQNISLIAKNNEKNFNVNFNGGTATAKKVYADADKLTISAGTINAATVEATKAMDMTGGTIQTGTGMGTVSADSITMSNGTMNGNDLTITSKTDIKQTGGQISATKATLDAGNTIDQTAGSVIAKDTVAKAGTDVKLASRTNKLQNVTVDAKNGSATIVSANDVDGDLNVTTVGNVANDLTITNLKNGKANKIHFDKSLKAGGNITITNEEADIEVAIGTTMDAKNISLVAENNGVKVTGGTVTATETVNAKANDITMTGGTLQAGTKTTLTAGNTIDQTAGSIISKNTAAKAGKDIKLASRTNKLQNVSVDAQKGSATIVSANDVDGDLNVTTIGNVAKDLTITNLENGKANKIHFDKNIKAGGNITITNEEADIEVATGTTMDAQNISLIAKNNDVNFQGGSVTAKDTVKAEAKNANVAGGTIFAKKVRAEADKLAISGGTINAATVEATNTMNMTGGTIQTGTGVGTVSADSIVMKDGKMLGDDLTVKSTKDIQQSGGQISATKATLDAGQMINQTAGSVIAKDTVAKAGTDVKLASRTNKLQNVSVDAQNGSATIVSANDTDNDLNVTTAGMVKDNLTITNLTNGIANKIHFDKNLKAGGNITITNEEANIEVATGTTMDAQNISLIAKNNNVNFHGGTVTAKDTVKAEAKNANVAGGTISAKTVHAEAEKLAISGGTINAAIVEVTKALDMTGGTIQTGTGMGTVSADSITMSDGTMTGNDLTIKATKDIQQTGGTISAAKATLDAGQMINQTAGSVIAKDTVAKAGTDVKLASSSNKLQNVTVDAQNGSATIVSANDADGDLNVTTDGKVKDNLTITNLKNGKANQIHFNKALKAGGDITITNEEADIEVATGTTMDAQNISLIAKNNNVDFNGGSVTAQDTVKAEAKNANVAGGTISSKKVHAESEKLVISVGAINAATVEATNAMDMTGGSIQTGTGIGTVSADSITMSNGTMAGHDLNIKATKDIQQTGGTISATKATLDAGNTIGQTAGSVIAKDTVAKAGKDINLASTTNKLQNVSVDAQHGSATIVSANNVDGDLNVTTVGNVANDLTITNLKNGKANKIHFDKSLKAGGSITITNEEADIEVADGSSMEATNVSLIAKNNNVNFYGGSVTAKDTVKAEAKNANVADGTISAKKVRAEAEKLAISGGTINAATVEATNAMDMTGGTIQTGTGVGTVSADSITTSNGTMDGNDLTIKAAKDIQQTGGTISAAKATLDAGQMINQTAGSVIAKDTVAKAGTDVKLASRTNKLQNVTVDAQNGSAIIVSANDADGDLNVTTVGAVAKDLTITNLKNGSANKIHFNKDLKAGGTISITNEEADIEVADGTMEATNILLTSTNDNVKFTGGKVTATDKITANAKKDVMVNGGVLTSNSMELKAGQDVVHDGGTILATKDALLDAGRNVLLQSGILKAERTDASVTLNAKGYVAEAVTGYELTDQGTLHVSAGAKNATTGRGIDLGSKTNKLATVTLESADGDVVLGNGGDTTLDVSVKEGTTVNGKIDIHNYEGGTANEMKIHGSLKATGDITITNDERAVGEQITDITIGKDVTSDEEQDVIEGNHITITAKGRILNNDRVTANKEVKMTSDEASVINPGSIATKDGNITLTAKDILANYGGDITAENGTISMDAGEEINNNTGIKANNGDVILKAGYSITNKKDEKGTGVIEASGKISMTTSGLSDSEMDDNSILNESEIKAGSDIIMDAAADLLNSGSLTSTAGKVTLKGAQKADDTHDIIGHVSNTGTIDAKGDILLSTKNGYVNNQRQITSAEGSVTMEAKKAKSHTGEEVIGDIYNVGESGSTQETAIKSKKGIHISTDYDFVNAGDYEVTGEGAIDITTNRHFINSGAMATTKGDVTITSIDGGIFNYETGDIATKDGNVTLHTQSKDADMWYLDETGEWLKVTKLNLKNVTTDENGDKYYTIGDKKHWVSEDGSVSNAGDIIANGKITLKSDNGNVTNYDDLSTPGNGKAETTGDIELSAANGMLYNKHDLEAGENITLVAKAGLQNFSYNIYAGKNITLHATDGDIDNTSVLESVAGDVMLLADNGNITNGKEGSKNSGNIATLGGSVRLEAKGKTKDAMTGKDVGHSVTNYGDIVAIGDTVGDTEGSGSITLKSEYGDVYNYDDFNTVGENDSEEYQYEKKNHLSVTGTFAPSYNAATSNIEISAANGKVYNYKKYLVALGNVSLTAKDDLGSAGDVILAGKDISLTNTEGDLYNSANLVSMDGNVSIKSEKGSVVNTASGKLVALNGNVSLEAGEVTKTDAKILLVDETGKVSESGISGAGDGIIKTEVYEEGGKTYTRIKDINGNVLKKGIEGRQEAFRKGDVVNRGDIVSLDTSKNQVDANGNIKAEAGHVTLKSANGNVTNYDDFTKMDDALGKADTIYNFLGGTGYEAGTAKAKFNDGTGYTADKHYILSDTSTEINAANGYLYNDFDMISHGDITLISGKDLTIGGTTGNVKSITADGKVVVRSSGGKLTNKNSLVAGKDLILDGEKGVTSNTGGILKAGEDGNISIVANEGNINIDKLASQKMAVAGTKKGDIQIDQIEGKDVALYTEDEDSKIHIKDNIKAGDHLFLQGNHFDLAKIDRTEDSVGTLFVDVNGISKDGGSGTVKGYLKLDIDGDVRFTKLNVTDADVNVGGKLGIDKLHVEGKAIFDSMGYVTGVYGRAPSHDDSHALYFDNGTGVGGYGMKLTADEFRVISEGDPEEIRAITRMKKLRNELEKASSGSETFGKDNGGWMNLYVDGPHDQRSNGLLLHIDTYFHSLNQRWSAEDLSSKLMDFKPYMGYMSHYDVPFTVYDRYNVLERQENGDE